jgi:hypothetical protein
MDMAQDKVTAIHFAKSRLSRLESELRNRGIIVEAADQEGK